MERSEPPFSDADVKEILERQHGIFNNQSDPKPTSAELRTMQDATMVDNPDQYFRIAYEVARPQAEAQVLREIAKRLEQRRADTVTRGLLGQLGIRDA